MAKVIVLASGKGGTGKSTLTTGISSALCKLNRKVLIVDCDSGMRGVDIMMNLTSEIVYDLSDVISGKCSISKAVYQSKVYPGLYLIPAPFESDDEISPAIFKTIINEIKKEFDYIIIDSPAGVGTGFATAISPADAALLIALAEPTSISGCQKVRKKLLNSGIKDIRLVINKFNRDSFEKLDVYQDLDEIIDKAGAQLIGLVPEDNGFAALVQKGIVATAKPILPLQIIDAIAKRLEGQNIPLLYK